MSYAQTTIIPLCLLVLGEEERCENEHAPAQANVFFPLLHRGNKEQSKLRRQITKAREEEQEEQKANFLGSNPAKEETSVIMTIN